MTREAVITHFLIQAWPLVVVQNPSTIKMMDVASSEVTKLTVASKEAT